MLPQQPGHGPHPTTCKGTARARYPALSAGSRPLEGAVPAAGAGQPCRGRAPPTGTASPRPGLGWGGSAGWPPEGLRAWRGTPRPACAGATAPAQRAPELSRI